MSTGNTQAVKRHSPVNEAQDSREISIVNVDRLTSYKLRSIEEYALTADINILAIQEVGSKGVEYLERASFSLAFQIRYNIQQKSVIKTNARFDNYSKTLPNNPLYIYIHQQSECKKPSLDISERLKPTVIIPHFHPVTIKLLTIGLLLGIVQNQRLQTPLTHQKSPTPNPQR
eukprot:snap_masked-scaffold_1-processed-gene-23.32-mRNA-1 protein AED:1.00 eAED:1.00 QI:0/0/0/0/1/1/3/0/172